MSLVQLTIKGISASQTQSGAYALVLSEMEGERTLPIIIGAFEAQSIVIALEKEIKPPRPLTHDLFKTLTDRYLITVNRILIHKLLDGVFYSSLICEKDGVEEVIDTRTSDAIALAVRYNAPIYTYENILDNAGVYLQIEDDLELTSKDDVEDFENGLETILAKEIEESNFEDDFTDLSLAELHHILDKAVVDEDYERAAKIRDEISKR